jgi:hypothetical protein
VEKFRFLVGWFDGCPSNDEMPTGIESQDDLLNEDNENVQRYEFELPVGMRDYACLVGAGYAFHDNFTGFDSTSTCQVWENDKWVDF